MNDAERAVELSGKYEEAKKTHELECRDGDRILALFPHLQRTEGGWLPVAKIINEINDLRLGVASLAHVCDELQSATAATTANARAVAEKLAEFRDTVLNQRGALAENGMTGDQVNDVLGEFDAILGDAALPADAVRPAPHSTMAALQYLLDSTAPDGQWADQAVHNFVGAMLKQSPPPATARSEAMKLAEQWKGRADDAGRLSRAVLSELPQSEKPARQASFEAWLCREMPEGTVIGDPKWWAPRIARAFARSETPAGGTAKVPEGWKLVPVEIDRATCRAMLVIWNKCMWDQATLETTWPLLVAVAPSQPALPQSDPQAWRAAETPSPDGNEEKGQ